MRFSEIVETAPFRYPRAVFRVFSFSWRLAFFAGLPVFLCPPLVTLQGQDEAGAATPNAGTTEARSSVESIEGMAGRDQYQIRTSGGDPRTRMMFNAYIQEYREDFRMLLFKVPSPETLEKKTLEARKTWRIPLKVELWGDALDVHKGKAFQSVIEIGPDNRLLIRLSVKLHDSFEEPQFRLELLRDLLIEQMLSSFIDDPGALTQSEIKAPEWIVHGLDQLISHRRGGSPSAFYRGFLASGQMLKPEEIFAMKDATKLEPVNYGIFRASSSAMVEALLDQPDGDEGMRTLLSDLGQPGSAPLDVLLKQHFPAVREMDQGLDKWWALEVAALGQQQGLEYLDWKETERLLDEILTIHLEAVPEKAAEPESRVRKLFDFMKPKAEVPAALNEPFDGKVSDFAAFLNRPGAKDQLNASFSRLQNLKRAGFPLYRPVYTAYEAVIAKLVQGQTRDLDVELQRIEEMRTKIRETLVRTGDYLNHFEATRAPERSKAFDDYSALRKSLEEKEPPRRNDRISRYLDDLEEEFR